MQQVAGIERWWGRAQEALTSGTAHVRTLPTAGGTRGAARARQSPSLPTHRRPRGERAPRRSRRSLRRWGRALVALFVVATMIAGALLTLPRDLLDAGDAVQFVKAQATALTIAAGFGIDQVNLTGQRFTADSDVYDALDLTNVRTFAAFDSEAALKRIERIPWVETAQITRVYPGTLDIIIRERTPAFIWSRGAEAYLVDGTGRVLGPMPVASNWALPRVAGEGAKSEAASMLAAIKRYPDIARQYAYAERIAERRWRIVLANGTVFELAADREIEGLEEIAHSREVASLLKGAPMIIDVRTPGRIAVRPSDVAVAWSPSTNKGSTPSVQR